MRPKRRCIATLCSEEATSTSRFRAWNCLASIYRGTEREGTVGPEGVAAADGRGGDGPWCGTDDGRLVSRHVIHTSTLLAHLRTPSLIAPITNPSNNPLFFFQSFFYTFFTLSFLFCLSLFFFFGLFHVFWFLPSGIVRRILWGNFVNFCAVILYSSFDRSSYS